MRKQNTCVRATEAEAARKAHQEAQTAKVGVHPADTKRQLIPRTHCHRPPRSLLWKMPKRWTRPADLALTRAQYLFASYKPFPMVSKQPLRHYIGTYQGLRPWKLLVMKWHCNHADTCTLTHLRFFKTSIQTCSLAPIQASTRVTPRTPCCLCLDLCHRFALRNSCFEKNLRGYTYKVCSWIYFEICRALILF